MRALLIVLDGVGAGNAPDAPEYDDAGADTLGHLLERLPETRLRTLHALGLGNLLRRAPATSPCACFGRMRERSKGKDSTTGHWELAGVILEKPFAVFRTFPELLVNAVEEACGVRFIGNCVSSGTDALQEWGDEHLLTGRPILYTSVDSVMQIAAHVDVIAPARLYEICRVARGFANAYRIGRVIARPFKGGAGAFERTAGRHDFSLPPPRTVLNALRETGVRVVSIGKTADLFAESGFSESHPTASNAEGLAAIAGVWRRMRDGLVFANLVDFDTLFGHRRDPGGFARALENFDAWLGAFMKHVRADDLLIVTADHGNDPTFRGTDHTREEVPLLMRHLDRRGPLGTRASFADVAATLAEAFGIPAWPTGESFLRTAPARGASARVRRFSERDGVAADPARRAVIET